MRVVVVLGGLRVGDGRESEVLVLHAMAAVVTLLLLLELLFARQTYFLLTPGWEDVRMSGDVRSVVSGERDVGSSPRSTNAKWVPLY